VAPGTGAAPGPGSARATLDRGPWRRMTQAELAGAIGAVLALDRAVAEKAVASLPGDDANSRGFTVPRTVNEGYVVEMVRMTSGLVGAVDPARVAPEWARECPEARQGEAACLESFARKVGRIAYRRPPEGSEIAQLVALAQRVLKVEGAGPADALRGMLSYVLLSPEFLYLWERGPSERETIVDGRVALSSHELAARLSFFYWAEPPDAQLSALADSGALKDPATVQKQSERLFADPRSDRLFRRFMEQWLGLDKVSGVSRRPGADGYELTPALQTALLDEAAFYLRHVVRQGDGSFRSLFATRSALVNRPLAAHYGLPRPAVDGFNPVPRKDGGLLTLGAFLVAAANHDAPSPTHFGVAIRDAVLCDSLAPPPEDADTSLPPLLPGGSVRTRVEAHVGKPLCAACHRFLDPIGFAALAYDHLGRPAKRAEDTSGFIMNFEGGGDRPFAGVEELMNLLGGSERARQCFARQWLRFGTGLDLGPEIDLPAAVVGVTGGPGDLRRLLASIVDSPAFRYRKPVTQ